MNESIYTDDEAAQAIIDIGKRMYDKGFVAANDGNLSIKLPDGSIWATPTGVSKGYMTKSMLVKLRDDGSIISGSMQPSSEIKMHLRVYQENSGVSTVVHAHPPVATAFAIAGIPLDKAILAEAVVQLGSVPIAPYATPGTQEVPDSIAPYCTGYNAVLLANHGALTWGGNLTESWFRMESLEYYATLIMYTGSIIGQATTLNRFQVQKLLDIRERLGIVSGGIPRL